MPVRECGGLYLRVDALWNDRNFFVNVQPETMPQSLRFSLYDTNEWEYIFIEHPDIRATDTNPQQQQGEGVLADGADAAAVVTDDAATNSQTLDELDGEKGVRHSHAAAVWAPCTELLSVPVQV